MYGDYEAQRHWMELTTNLPVADWYRNTTDNDLQYWGLDYPPLTAYHSYVVGVASRAWEPASMQLHTSRGYESFSHKVFMRGTVLLFDVLTLIPALWLLFTSYYRYVNRGVRQWYLLLILSWPGLLLIDHGHFQYNCIMLGLVLFAAHAAIHCNLLLSSLLFTLALNFKITALYYSLPFFVVLLLRAKQQANYYSARFRSTVSGR